MAVVKLPAYLAQRCSDLVIDKDKDGKTVLQVVQFEGTDEYARKEVLEMVQTIIDAFDVTQDEIRWW